MGKKEGVNGKNDLQVFSLLTFGLQQLWLFYLKKPTIQYYELAEANC